jgi:hypothetical protein
MTAKQAVKQLQQGKSNSQLKRASSVAKQAKQDDQRKARDFEATTFSKTEITDLIPGVLPEGDTALLVGKKDEMKSQMVYHLIACVTSGKDFAEEVVPTRQGEPSCSIPSVPSARLSVPGLRRQAQR